MSVDGRNTVDGKVGPTSQLVVQPVDNGAALRVLGNNSCLGSGHVSQLVMDVQHGRHIGDDGTGEVGGQLLVRNGRRFSAHVSARHWMSAEELFAESSTPYESSLSAGAAGRGGMAVDGVVDVVDGEGEKTVARLF